MRDKIICLTSNLPKREKIFRNLEYDTLTKKIYKTGCEGGEIGESVKGKVRWYKRTQ